MRALLLLLIGCDPTSYVSGAGEPLRVTDAAASFHEGRLPVDDARETPAIVYATGVGSLLTLGQGNVPYNGLATTDAFSVGLALDGVGSGHWVVPVDGPDVTQEGQLLFDFALEVTPDVPYGLQSLDFVAIDGRGEGGPRYRTTLCLLPEVAAGSFWACDPAVTPQSAVIWLTWDTEVDLDLVVVTPDGKVVQSKTPSTAIATGPIEATVVADPSTGTLTRDSNADCDIDGIHLESLVFPGEPPPGEYQVFARLHQACGQPAVHWRAEVLRRVEGEGGTQDVETTPVAVGTLLSSQFSRDGALGTFVGTVTLP
jgi:hypothetical protein